MVVTTDDDVYLTEYFRFMFIVTACHVKGCILTTGLTVYVETMPTLGICFQCCCTKCFCEYIFLGFVKMLEILRLL
jgi:hypothetical protein